MKRQTVMWALMAALLIAFAGGNSRPANAAAAIRVGSKNFTEGYILAEICAQLLEASGYTVDRRFGLSGTLVCYEALTNAEIDLYPEYTGTITQAILKLDNAPRETELRERLRVIGLDMLAPLGFNNTYAVALQRERAQALGLVGIGDLARYPDLRLAFSHEFNERHDGWPGLKQVYGLPHTPAGIEHGLAYQAIDGGQIDVTDVYSTDGDIERYDLVLLEDDRGYFPRYLAVPLVRAGLDPRVNHVLSRLGGTIDAPRMRALNASVLLGGKTFAEVASEFLVDAALVATASDPGNRRVSLLLRRTLRHLELTLAALIVAILVAVPLGILVYRKPRVAGPVIYVAGALQTIPSIALLAFMIPLFGIGVTPAIVALFLYALLPILRNTSAALLSVDPIIRKVGEGMGLSVAQRLRHVELPLAAPTILAGVKTAAVINIGTATLAAFIGAGGLGEPIVTGLALGDTRLILEGAIPAAALALLTEWIFEGIERGIVPPHLT